MPEKCNARSSLRRMKNLITPNLVLNNALKQHSFLNIRAGIHNFIPGASETDQNCKIASQVAQMPLIN